MTIRVDSLRRGFLLFLLAAGLVLPSMATVAQAAEVTVFAAASLKNALDDAAKAYEANTGAKVVTSYAASSALAKQIESGANADIFFSADLDWMDYLQQKNLINSASRKTLLGNTLVLVAPKTRPYRFQSRRIFLCSKLSEPMASLPWPAWTRCQPGSTAKRL